MHGFQDLGIAAHSEIIIGAPYCDSLVLVGHVGLWEFLGQTIDIIEVAVGLVFVLLFEFGTVEFFVVEFRSLMADRSMEGLRLLEGN